ncbi:MAG: hypothetical protein JO056_05475 [Alphaproteobacteria bacterium]|nr:hypothetical protein [Alphaproteobacteria bacterium]
MSRFACMLAAVLAAAIVWPASAEPTMNAFGIPVAPNGGSTSIHQWGGIDDVFAVDPDGGEAQSHASHKSASPLAKDQQDSDSGDSDEPDADHIGEILPI